MNIQDMQITKAEPVLQTLKPTKKINPLYRMDGYGQRFYYQLQFEDEKREPVGVSWFPSITSVQKAVFPLSSAIIAKMMQMGSEAWYKYLNNKAAFGTFWHMLAAEYLTEGRIDLKTLPERIDAYRMSDPNATDTSWWYEQAWKGMLSWIAFCKEHAVEPLLIESPLAFSSDDYQFAGTVDLFCKMNDAKGKQMLAIIDWKTGDIWDEYACQLFLQRMAICANFAMTDSIKLFNWTWTDWRKSPGWALKDQTDSPFAKTAVHALAVHKLTQPEKPKGVRMPDVETEWSVDMEPEKAFIDRTIDEIVIEKYVASLSD